MDGRDGLDRCRRRRVRGRRRGADDLAAGLPRDLDAAVCVVLHLPAGAESRLAEILFQGASLTRTDASMSK